MTLIAQGSWCKCYFSFAGTAQPGYVVWLRSGPNGHSVHPSVPLSHGRNEISSFGFCRWLSMLPKDHKVCAGVFDMDLTMLLRRIPLGVAVYTWLTIYFQMQHVSSKRRLLRRTKSNTGECDTGSNADFWTETLISAKKLPWSPCSPIREMSTSAQLSSSLVNTGMFLLNSFGEHNYSYWPCLPTLPRPKEKACDFVRSEAPSLYCFHLSS